MTFDGEFVCFARDLVLVDNLLLRYPNNSGIPLALQPQVIER